MDFQLTSQFIPTGDQPQAIKSLTEGIKRGDRAQVLLGVTGSGKTFTMANVIAQVQKPTLIISHNKTLVAQLYGEFQQFFPNNAIEYFVSYYDYYQPEAFIPSSNTYIEKDLQINQEIEKLRLKTTSSLLSGRRDIVVLASVSCIYGAGNPKDYENSIIRLNKGDKISRNSLLFALVDSLYSRTTAEFSRGNFRVKGEVVDVFPAYADMAFRISFFGDEIEELTVIDPISGRKQESLNSLAIFPANIYVTPKDQLQEAIRAIQDDLVEQVAYFKSIGKPLEAKRIEERTNFDLEMIRELGYCSGIENYSRYMDKRKPGERPFCLIDYFPEDFLLIVDESHATMPQVRAMYGGDRSRKENLVEYGFRLPSAMDNRPLKFNEFEMLIPQTIFVSATPADYEVREAEGIVVEQIIRPTGLLDPVIEVRPCLNQVDDLMDEIDERIKMGDRILVTTLTKRMAEELSKYFSKLNIKCRYIHSEVKTIDRVEILRDLRLGKFDVLIGVNLLREGLDLPEVSLVAIMDADKEGFLRNERSLTQTIGRAARNENGKVIMYADRVTDSMQRTMDENIRKREIQIAYNLKNGITPATVKKSIQEIMQQTSVADSLNGVHAPVPYIENEEISLAADPVFQHMNKEQLQKAISETQKRMYKAAKEMDFMEAARLRDEMYAMQKNLPEEKIIPNPNNMSKFSEIQKRFKFDRYTGFGAGANNQADRLLNRNGTFNVTRTGQSFLNSINPFHQMIMMPWSHFILMILSFYLGLNLLFTGVYFGLGLDQLLGIYHTDRISLFIEIFSFSAQTLTTVGYGRVSPIGNIASMVASFEALTGLMSFALITGLIYGRFSRPHAKLLSSENALISPFQGKTALMFRIANARKNQLVECEAVVLFNYIDKETGARRFINLDLEYAKVNALSLSWTIVHPIDENSPLNGLNQKELEDMSPEVIFMFKAFDDTYSQVVHTRLSYTIQEFVWGAKFDPMYLRSEDGMETLLELNKIGQFQKVELPD